MAALYKTRVPAPRAPTTHREAIKTVPVARRCRCPKLRTRHLKEQRAVGVTQDSASTAAATPSNGSTNGSGTSTKATNTSPTFTLGSLDATQAYNLEKNDWTTSSLSVVVAGASGDLAKKKIFPALFALYYQGLLPKNFQIFGYARSKMTDEEFRNTIEKTLTCRVDAGESCGKAMAAFLERCFYQPGNYEGALGYMDLANRMTECEKYMPRSNRMFFLSVPPNVFVGVAAGAADYCSSRCEHPGPPRNMEHGRVL